jgi:hypothetical protein
MKLSRLLYELLVESKEAQLRKNFVKTGKLTDQEFDKIIEADPTNIKKYSEWLMNKFYKDFKKPNLDDKGNIKPGSRREVMRFFEDLPATTNNLELFNRIGAKFPKKNIQDYGFDEFQHVSAEVKEKLGDTELSKGKESGSKYPELEIGNVEGYTVYKLPQNRPDLEPVACDLGKEMGWCTADGHYNRYNRNDAIFIFAKGSKKFQHDQHSGEWKASGNREMKGVDPELLQKFKEFLGKVEGRLYDANQLQSLPEYKIGDYDSPSGKLPLYKVGNKLYTIINNTAFYYDPDIKKFKDVKGGNMRIELLFKEPYMSFTKEVYNELKEQGNTKVFPGIYRLLLNLDVPEKAPGEYWVIPDGLDISGTDLDKLPDNLHIQGDLDISDTKIKNLPQNLKVDGEIIK